ncbi:MAG: FAD-dependent oxidoreductase [Acidimicrobiia bacterium]|nr:FAD-dependent oxidoreductase [Acidimicrobiia bacterium]
MNGRRRVVVIGGGLAGLSAAVEAADGGAGVTLLERRPRLGGATWSFERRGVFFDNGQHVFMRCCEAYRRFLERIGSAGDVRLQSRLEVPVLRPGGPPGAIRRSRGPAPLHLLAALATYPHLSRRRRLAVVRAALALRRLDPDDAALDRLNFDEWLDARGQDAATVETFWDLIVLPTVNVPSAEASLKLAAKVFGTGLLRRADAADIGWAAVPLSVLHGEAARRTIEAAGGEVRTAAAVRGVRRGAAGRPVVELDGEFIDADAVVVAVPHDAAGGLLPPGAVAHQERLAALGTSPLLNVHLGYDRSVTELPMAAAVGSDVEYIFDRSAAAGLNDGRQCLTISLSAARRHIGRRSADLVEHFSAETARLLPGAAAARITESMVTRERAATFVGAPGSHALRAAGPTALEGVFLAGAWCDTGWPATMEGAVRSGVQAGRLAAEHAAALTASGSAPTAPAASAEAA